MQLSVFTSETPLSKTFRPGPDGVEKLPGGKLSRGFVERKTFLGLDDFAQYIGGLNGINALAYGVPKHDYARVLSRKESGSEKGGDLPVILRTRQNFSWPTGEGVFMLDHDVRKDGQVISSAQLLAALHQACPELSSAPTLLMHSASSHIYEGDKVLTGQAGMRVYIRVKSASDIPRAGKALFKRLWLAGFGYIEIGKSGSLYEKTLIDRSVWDPERLDFAGGACCEAPYHQNRPDPVVMNEGFDADAFDTSVIEDLTDAEEAQYKTIVAEAKAAVKEQAARKREDWLLSLPEDRRDIVSESMESGVLPADFILRSVNGDEFTVAEALANKDKYHGVYVEHPFEPDYQDNDKLAQLKLDNNPRPCVHTFAHGGQNFWLDTAEAAFKDVEPERQPGPIQASTLSLMDTPPREWLLGKRYVTKFITATVAPGGGSKSTLVMQEALSVAMGKSICGEDIKVTGKVWIANGEDPLDEVQRRLAAICMHFKLDPVEDTKNVFLSGKEFDMKFAEPGEKGQFKPNQVTIARVENFIIENDIKLWVIDPFVSCHGFPEGDNTNLNFVMKIISGICDRTKSSCSVVAHSPKNVDVSGNADAWRGAGATRDAARIMDTVAVMNEKECKVYGVSPEARTWYVKRESAKANMRPPGEDLKWFKRISVLLPNGQDHIGVLEQITLDRVETVPAEDSFLISVVFSMMNDGDAKTVNSVTNTILEERGEELEKLMGGLPSPNTLNTKLISLFTTPQKDEEGVEVRYVNKRIGASKASKYLTAKLVENDTF